jgi:integrase
LDKKKLSEITEAECRAWGKRFSEQFEAVNFNNTLSSLRNILKRGGLGHDRNPAMKLKRLGVKPKDLILPEPHQFVAMLKAIETSGAGQARHCADLVRFLAFSGCRISEAKRVQWQDVNFERSEFRSPTIKRSRTSSAREYRFVPLLSEMKELLVRMQGEQQPKQTDSVCVLGECQKSLTRACEIVGVPRITHHDLRHLFATRCIESGVDIPTVSRWLGHVDGGALCMKIYGHLRRSHSQESAKLVAFGTSATQEVVAAQQLPSPATP